MVALLRRRKPRCREAVASPTSEPGSREGPCLPAGCAFLPLCGLGLVIAPSGRLMQARGGGEDPPPMEEGSLKLAAVAGSCLALLSFPRCEVIHLTQEQVKKRNRGW